MNRLKRNLICDFNYITRSKAPLVIIIIILAVCAAFAFFQYDYVKSYHDNYLSNVDFYEKNGFDIEEELNSENYRIIESDDGMTTVENPLSYNYEMVSNALFTASGEYSTSHILELGVLVFPILFSVIGIIMATVDSKNHVFKHKILRYGRQNYMLSKFISFLIITITIILLFVITNKLSTYILDIIIKNNFDTKSFTTSLTSDKAAVIQILVGCLISITYISIGFLLGIVTKNGILSVGVIAIYLYIIPLFSKYEIKNCCYIIMKKAFDFMGLIKITEYKRSDNTILSVIILFSIILFFNLISYFVIKNRSAYK